MSGTKESGLAKGAKVAVVVSRYNESITRRLLEGALETLGMEGVSSEQIDVHWVPGAWELPLGVQHAFSDPRVVGVVALGAVIQGETSHDQHINRAVSQGLMELSLGSGKPVGFGLLTVQNLEQALQRAGGAVGNKGQEASLAVMEMARLLRKEPASQRQPIGLGASGNHSRP
ncbi:MAG: 6,7-dimethyl-8-ribityllumazine synthase [Pirellulaceae bacterium]|jgi:6,7-dimethyl-8-ribityllumazine synthase